MDRQDLELEEFSVPEAVRLPLHRLDLVVRPLHRATADHDVVVRQQTTTVRRQRRSHLLQHFDPRGPSTAYPAIEEEARKTLAGLLPELAQILLHVVGRRQ